MVRTARSLFFAASRWARLLLAFLGFLTFRACAAWAEARGSAPAGILEGPQRGMQDPGVLRTWLGPWRASGCFGSGLWRGLWTEAARIPAASLKFLTSTGSQCRRRRAFRATYVRFWGGWCRLYSGGFFGSCGTEWRP